MQKKNCFITTLCLVVLLTSCQNYAVNKLKRNIKPLAKEYLSNDNIQGYKELTITCVDTLSDMSYAKLSSELLRNMEDAYQLQLDKAYEQNDEKATYLQLYVNEIARTREDLESLLSSGDLQRDNTLLYMVTGSYITSNNEPQDFMFLVNPDKKTLHTLDPFGDNLLYRDVE